MTAAEFRRLALSLPEATEGAHHGHTDFRVAGRIFASLGYPSEEFAVVQLTPQPVATLGNANPSADT